MPKAAPINPTLVRAIFDYDPETGHLIPNKLAAKPAALTSRNPRQWLVGVHRYREHRLVWAWHHHTDPIKANPYSVRMHNGDEHDSRIENLYPVDTNPRWVGHVKQVPIKLDKYGRVIVRGAPQLPPEPQAEPEQHTPAPAEPTPTPPTTTFEDLDHLGDDLPFNPPRPTRHAEPHNSPSNNTRQPQTGADYDPWEGFYE